MTDLSPRDESGKCPAPNDWIAIDFNKPIDASKVCALTFVSICEG